MPLHIDYRPKTFDEFVGNEALKKSLQSSIGNLHTYLFSGIRGAGKTTLARLLADALGTHSFDRHEVNIADRSGVDDAREIIQTVPFMPVAGDRKIYILDEFHRATKNAQDCWLTTLEQPPKHAFFALCTTNIKAVEQTIRSRSAEYKVSQLTKRQILKLLEEVCQAEELEVSRNVLLTIAGNCDGVPREALVRLDMCKDLGEEDAEATAKQGVVEDAQALEILKVLLSKASAMDKWAKCSQIMKGNLADKDVEGFRQALLTMLANTLLTTKNPLAISSMLEHLLEPYFNSGRAGLVYSVFACCAVAE